MSDAGQTSNAQAVAIRNVEEGFTWQGLLKPKSFFVDEVATEVHILGALAGKELVGTIVYDVMKAYEDRAEVELYILDAHVKPKWQRQGVFTGLFNAMTQRHPGCRVAGHFADSNVERMAARFNQTIVS